MPILGKQRQPEWETIWQTIDMGIRLFGADPNGLGMYSLVSNVRSLVGKTFEQIDDGRPFVLYNLGFNPEMILGLGGAGAGHLCVSLITALASLIGDQADTEALIDAAEAAGYSAECCSADKGGIGALVKELYPEPACMVGINTPCDSQVSVSNAMAERYNHRPLFVIDVPPYEDERAIKHVASQLMELVPFLETNTGLKFDWDRLKTVCERSNRTSENLWEWMEMRSRPPSMQPSKLCAMTMAMMITMFGTEEGENLSRDFAKDARAKLEAGAKYFDEKARAVWYQDPVWWDMQVYDWMEHELGLTIPVDVFGFYAAEGLIDTSSEEKMLEGLATKMIMCHPMSRQFRSNMKRYIDDFMYMHEKFQADCGIMAGHIACKHSWGGVGLFKEACRKAGIPLLVFEFDMFDSRILTYRELQFELRRFVNDVVLPGKERKAAGGIR